MGNTASGSNSTGKVVEDGVFDVKKIYWDQQGNLRYGLSDRNRDEEVIDILQNDHVENQDPNKIWMIIPSRWIRKWLLFAHLKVCEPPGKINMFSLLTEDSSVEGGWRPLKTLLPPLSSEDPKVEDRPGHYRRVSVEAWNRLIDLYGVTGYAIAVKGNPVDEKSRWRVFKNPRVIDPSVLPDPIIEEEDDKKKENEKEKEKGKKVFGGLF